MSLKFFCIPPPIDPCDGIECPIYASCQKFIIFSGFEAAYCLPSCDLANGGCGENDECSLVPQSSGQCPADAPCPPLVQCRSIGMCMCAYIYCLHWVYTGHPLMSTR